MIISLQCNVLLGNLRVWQLYYVISLLFVYCLLHTQSVFTVYRVTICPTLCGTAQHFICLPHVPHIEMMSRNVSGSSFQSQTSAGQMLPIKFVISKGCEERMEVVITGLCQ